jgi:hypothetical protein
MERKSALSNVKVFNGKSTSFDPNVDSKWKALPSEKWIFCISRLKKIFIISSSFSSFSHVGYSHVTLKLKFSWKSIAVKNESEREKITIFLIPKNNSLSTYQLACVHSMQCVWKNEEWWQIRARKKLFETHQKNKKNFVQLYTNKNSQDKTDSE